MSIEPADGALNRLPDIAAWAAVVAALVRPGGALHHSVHARWPFLVRGEDRLWRLPEGMPAPPIMYSLRARAPG